MKTGDIVRLKNHHPNIKYEIISHEGYLYTLYCISDERYNILGFSGVATEDELELVWSTDE